MNTLPLHFRLLDVARAIEVGVALAPKILGGSAWGAYWACDLIQVSLEIDCEVSDPNVVLAHELIHATGHYARLNRAGIGLYTRVGYHPLSESLKARHSEERIAETGSLALLAKLGISTIHGPSQVARFLNAYGMPTEIEAGLARQAVNYAYHALLEYERQVA